MTDISKEERRALSQDELELVSRARHPDLSALGAGELSALVRQLRDRRDRARDLAERQRREMRGKAAPAGAEAARDDGGTRSKEHFLGAALSRARDELQRREGEEPSQAELSREALQMRRHAEQDRPEHPDPGASSDEGMQPIPNDGIAPSGAFDAEGDRPVVERSRKVR
jgi:hypothetical protein